MTDESRPARRHAAFSPRLSPARVMAPAVILGLLGGGRTFGQPATERVEHAIEIEAETMITVMNFAGNVEVHGTDPGEDRTLRIVGVKRLTADLPAAEAAQIFERVDLDLRRRGRRIHIGPRPRRNSSGSREGETPITDIRAPRRIPPVSVDLEVWLPDGASIEVRTFSAPITITDVSVSEGTVLLRSISGALTVSGIDCHDLRAETVSGELRLRDVVSHRSEFKTLTAGIQFDGDFHSEGWYEFQTHSGPVVLGLGSLPGFEVDATTYTGAIRNDLEVESHTGPRSLECRHGEGGPQISVNTFSGLIHLAEEVEAGTPAKHQR